MTLKQQLLGHELVCISWQEVFTDTTVSEHRVKTFNNKDEYVTDTGHESNNIWSS